MPVRILVLAWGFSIHACRRIRIFESDPDYSVTVVSTHDYAFRRATNVLLHDAGRNRSRGIESDRAEVGPTLSRRLQIVVESLSGFLARFAVVLLPFELLKLLKDLFILRKAVRQCRPQVIVLQTLLYPCYLAFLMPRSIPVIITFWNGDLTWWARSTGIERMCKKQLLKYGMGRATALTVNSRTAMIACRAHGVPEKKVHLIRYPGVDRQRFRPSGKAEARHALGIDASRVILCPRGIGGYLNSDVIVESTHDVVRRFPDIVFLFVSGAGDKYALRRHRDRAKELGVEKNLRWDGQVPWEEMPRYYNASDVVISISSRDSLPNCMMEALSCGTPVIMGDIPQIREWISDGENGFLVPPRDANTLSRKIMEVLGAAPERILRITETGRELVAREFDQSVNSRLIKDLVRRTAGHDDHCKTSA